MRPTAFSLALAFALAPVPARAGTVIHEFPLPTVAAQPDVVTHGPDSSMWFLELGGNQVGRITPAGVITEFPRPNAGSGPQCITAGPDGDLWCAERTGDRIGRITPAGAITEFSIPTAASRTQQIIDTLLLSASTDPVPDVIALGATPIRSVFASALGAVRSRPQPVGSFTGDGGVTRGATSAAVTTE